MFVLPGFVSRFDKRDLRQIAAVRVRSEGLGISKMVHMLRGEAVKVVHVGVASFSRRPIVGYIHSPGNAMLLQQLEDGLCCKSALRGEDVTLGCCGQEIHAVGLSAERTGTKEAVRSCKLSCRPVIKRQILVSIKTYGAFASGVEAACVYGKAACH